MSKPQATVLAWWSLGLGLARSSALTAVAACLAMWLRRQEQTVRQPWRAWCYEAEAKRGDQRQAVDPQACLVLRWPGIVGQWPGTPLALALEATSGGTRFTGLAISVVSRGGAMPVAWTILPATPPQAWRRAWWRRLRVGGMAAAAIPDRTLLDVSAALRVQRRQRRATRRRLGSAFRRGWTLILGARLDHEPWPLGTFLPEPWPMIASIDATSIVHDSGVLDDVAA